MFGKIIDGYRRFLVWLILSRAENVDEIHKSSRLTYCRQLQLAALGAVDQVDRRLPARENGPFLTPKGLWGIVLALHVLLIGLALVLGGLELLLYAVVVWVLAIGLMGTAYALGWTLPWAAKFCPLKDSRLEQMIKDETGEGVVVFTITAAFLLLMAIGCLSLLGALS